MCTLHRWLERYHNGKSVSKVYKAILLGPGKREIEMVVNKLKNTVKIYNQWELNDYLGVKVERKKIDQKNGQKHTVTVNIERPGVSGSKYLEPTNYNNQPFTIVLFHAHACFSLLHACMHVMFIYILSLLYRFEITLKHGHIMGCSYIFLASG